MESTLNNPIEVVTYYNLKITLYYATSADASGIALKTVADVSQLNGTISNRLKDMVGSIDQVVAAIKAMINEHPQHHHADYLLTHGHELLRGAGHSCRGPNHPAERSA